MASRPTAASAKRSKEKHPWEKKPKTFSAYLCFSTSRRPEVAKANPALSFGEVAKLVGQQWQALKDAPAQRAEWEAASKKANAAALRAVLAEQSAQLVTPYLTLPD